MGAEIEKISSKRKFWIWLRFTVLAVAIHVVVLGIICIATGNLNPMTALKMICFEESRYFPTFTIDFIFSTSRWLDIVIWPFLIATLVLFFSSKRVREDKGLLLGLSVGLSIGLTVGLFCILIFGMVFDPFIGLFFALFVGFLLGLIRGLIDKPIAGVLAGLSYTLLVGTFFALVHGVYIGSLVGMSIVSIILLGWLMGLFVKWLFGRLRDLTWESIGDFFLARNVE